MMMKYTPLALAVMLASTAAFATEGPDPAPTEAPSFDAEITQDGSDNSASIAQGANTAYRVTINQDGDGNNTLVHQSGAREAGVTAEITINGDRNVFEGHDADPPEDDGSEPEELPEPPLHATINQINSTAVSARVNVTGDGNTLSVLQRNVGGTKAGATKTADITIAHSDDGTAKISQDGVNLVTASIIQRGTEGSSVTGNSATITQSGGGTTLEARISQTTGGNNTATIEQLASTSNSIVIINQEGGDNTSSITQNGTNTEGNEVSIDITGSSNGVGISQTGVTAVHEDVKIEVDGSTNTGVQITQTTVSNINGEVKIDIDGDDNTLAEITQTNVRNITNDVTITLDGIGNQGKIRQVGVTGGASDTVKVDIVGEDSVGRIEQQNTDNSNALIEQRGGFSDNLAEINQTGTVQTRSTALSATIRQSGGGFNEGRINQTNGASTSTATITQGGGSVRALARITQTATGQSQAAITQTNVRNTGTANNLRTSYISQAGTNQQATVTISNGDSSYTEVDQSGSGHVTTITQSGDRNFAKLTQTGAASSNTADLTQSGADNRVTVTQTGGTGLSFNINQGGSFNTLDLNQAGVENNVTNLIVTGTYNEIDVDQRTGSNQLANITQSGTGVVGNLNVATIEQVGSNVTASIIQRTGAGNNATIRQF